MTPEERRRSLASEEKRLAPELEIEEDEDEGTEDDELEAGRIQAFLQDRRKLASTGLLFVLLLVAIYVLVPKLTDTGDTLDRIGDATWYWVVVAIGFNALSFLAYTALFRGVLGGRTEDDVQRRLDMRASYQVTMAAFAATLLFSAAGAGGLALTYWALRKAGMPRRRSACRMVAFLVMQYGVYLLAVVLFGILLRTGVLNGFGGKAPLAGTIIPAALAGVFIVIFLLISLIPGDVERRMASFAGGYRRAHWVRRMASVPATVSTGVRTALAHLRDPRSGWLALGGAVGYWAANIGVLWASFKAFGVNVPFGVVVQGFFVGMAANLLPSAAGGVGSIDAGMIGAFVLFGLDAKDVFPAILTFRAIFFWLPILPGVVAYFQLRHTVAGWDEEREQKRRPKGYTSESKVRTAEAS
ncbi:MAG TPA: lysylphosphatidylglycerol synthase transmembrane domain-containing protein [Thermoleophilaceae bacterium]